MVIKFAFGMVGAVSALVMALVIAVFQAGFLTVQIEGPETPSIYLPVPLAALDVAMAFVPEEELAEARRELQRFSPVIGALLSELRNCPDVTLVEAVDRGESVLIVKEGTDLLINVEGAGREKVRIRVPLDGVERTLAAVMGVKSLSS